VRRRSRPPDGFPEATEGLKTDVARTRGSASLGFRLARRRALPFSLGSFLLCLTAHAEQIIDQRIDRLALLCLATHPNQRIEKVVDGFSLYFFIFVNSLASLSLAAKNISGIRIMRITVQ
jgi:hypothetical protein